MAKTFPVKYYKKFEEGSQKIVMFFSSFLPYCGFSRLTTYTLYQFGARK